MKTIRAEVITIGDEILYGHITDTNTQYISEQLSNIGVKVLRKSSIGDVASEIISILNEAAQRVDIIILTGGLGPTKDDVTKSTLATYFGVHMVVHEPTLIQITEYFAKKGKEMLKSNINQANVPSNCQVLPNTMGTAPGMWIERDNKIYISLPGVPYEMKHIMQTSVIAKIKRQIKTPIIIHKMVHTFGIGESFLAQIIENWEDNLPENIRLAYLPSLSIVKLRLTGIGENKIELKKVIDKCIEELIPLIKPYIFAYDNIDKIELVVGQFLISRKLTLATAESCTGGLISHLITSISGSSVYFKGGIIAYDNTVKVNLLHVKTETLANYGAVSQQTVEEMAIGARIAMSTDIAIATSGIAGPNGGSDEKPVGTVWIAFSNKNITVSKLFNFTNNRENTIKSAALHTLNFLLQNM